MTTNDLMTIYDVIIIGSGPAGLAGGIYTSRAGLKTLMLAGEKWGGQLMLTTLVENYPGFVDGIQGPDLMTNMRKQAEKFGVQILDEDAKTVEFAQTPFKVNSYLGKAVIVATGAEFKWLGVLGEQKLIGSGVSACATCDAAFFKNKKVVVVGGGDAAMEEALVLAKFASEVTVVHRRGEFRASKIMQDRVLSNPKIKTRFNTEVIEVLGEQKLTGVKVKTMDNGQWTMDNFECQGLFVAIGHTPATKIFEGKLDLDEKSYLLRNNQETITKIQTNSNNQLPKYKSMSNVEGVFVAGDVHDHTYRQAITAAAYGVEAALDCEKWLTE